MKLPFIKMPFSMRDLDTAVRMAPIIKKVFTSESEPEPGEPELAGTIKKLENTLHDKKAEIFTLRQKIKELTKKNENLQDILNDYNTMLFNKNSSNQKETS